MSYRPIPSRPSRGRLLAPLWVLAVSLLSSLVPTPAAVWGQPVAKTLLIDDFEDNDLEARSGLSWVVFSDDQLGGTSQARIGLTDGGAPGSRHALRFSGRTTEASERKIAAVWVPVAREGLPEDLSAYDGIRFFARGEGQTFRAGLRRGRGRMANYTQAFTAPEEWTRIEVPYVELAKHPQGATSEDWTPEDIRWLGFSVPTDFLGTFVLEIDGIEFYREPEPRAAEDRADGAQQGEPR
jgi:hypothetical protein